MSVTNRKLILKNSAFLYLRMLISMVVSLYTSRIVLEALGVDNFGVYNVVGSIVAFMGFLNESLSAASSRFFTFEIGQNNLCRAKDTFSATFIIHSLLAILVIVICETVGVWIVETQLSIPVESMNQARWVFQLSIFGAVIAITQVPYTAAVIAHEHMKIYAYVQLATSGLRLGLVYLLLVLDNNRLVWYAVFVASINFIVAMGYRIYCMRHFKECRIVFRWKWNIIKPMLTFSVWDIFGNVSISTRFQGGVMLLNTFFGVAINAANSIATQINNALMSFSTNIVTAFRPQIIKNYSIGNISDFSVLIVDAVKFSTIAFVALVIPLSIEIDYVLSIWLVNPPPHTATFCRVIMWASVVGAANMPLQIGIQATTCIKYYNVVLSLLNMSIIGVSYFVFWLGMASEAIYYVTLAVNMLLVPSSFFILSNLVTGLNGKLFWKTIILLFVVATMTSVISECVALLMGSTFIRLIVVSFTSLLSIATLSYFLLLDRVSKNKIRQKVYNIFR